ncbi:hypothetical protein [Aedoeadaptatus pacaensis]|uniref:hypothetical protein n=1 Tax=Aedoeadaptatus pacaensis TaxID=1776390 RepID=UPI000837EE1F|nr:hypothetical protein [Peptoniphilus pacaensis]
MNHCMFSGKVVSKEAVEQFTGKDGRTFDSMNFQLEVENQKEKMLVPCRYISSADTDNNLMTTLGNLEDGQDVILMGKLNIRSINFGLTTITESSIYVRSIEILKSKYNIVDEDDNYMIIDKMETPF